MLFLYTGPTSVHTAKCLPFCYIFPQRKTWRPGFKFAFLNACSQEENITRKMHMGSITLSWPDKTGKTSSHLHRNK